MELTQLKAFRKAIHDLIAELTGVAKNHVIWANQNAPKNSTPYITLNIISQADEAMREIRPTGTTGVYNIVVPVSVTLTVQMYGDIDGISPHSTLVSLVRGLERPTVVERCSIAGIAVYDAENVINITALLNDGQTYEQRAAVDLHIRYMHYVTDDMGNIAEITANGTILNSATGQDVTVTPEETENPINPYKPPQTTTETGLVDDSTTSDDEAIQRVVVHDDFTY